MLTGVHLQFKNVVIKYTGGFEVEGSVTIEATDTIEIQQSATDVSTASTMFRLQAPNIIVKKQIKSRDMILEADNIQVIGDGTNPTVSANGMSKAMASSPVPPEQRGTPGASHKFATASQVADNYLCVFEDLMPVSVNCESI